MLASADDRVGLAVSGGPDSLALLLLAHAACPGKIEAATVDHGLRAGSAAEAAFVAQVCMDIGVRHSILPVSVGKGSLQAVAREARYAALADWARDRGLAMVATAHHADDQAETLLMRLNRGSGVAGLAGIRSAGLATGGQLRLVRPLLAWRRSELAAIVTGAGIQAVDDPSNSDPRFDRSRLRLAIAASDWLNVPAIAASAAHLADADSALDWAAQRLVVDCVTWERDGAVFRPVPPKALCLRIMAFLIDRLGSAPARGSAVARAYDALSAGKSATLAGVMVRPQGQNWHFTPEVGRGGIKRRD